MSTTGFMFKTTAARYRLGDAGSAIVIPDVKYVHWSCYRAMTFADYGETSPPVASDARTWGTLMTHDAHIALILCDLTPRGLDPVTDYDLFPQLLVYYEDASRTKMFRVFKPVIFCSYPGASMFTMVGQNEGLPQVQTIPFRIAMPADALVQDHIYDGFVT